MDISDGQNDLWSGDNGKIYHNAMEVLWKTSEFRYLD